MRGLLLAINEFKKPYSTGEHSVFCLITTRKLVVAGFRTAVDCVCRYIVEGHQACENNPASALMHCVQLPYLATVTQVTFRIRR